MSKLHISDSLSLPIDAVTQTFGIVGKKGSGKTVTGSVLAEEFLKAKIAPVIIDPLDVWWGLKSEFPVYVFGGSHADVPLEPESGKVIARLVAEKHPPIILSTRHLENQQQYSFVADFANELLKINEGIVPVIIDEADKSAPQRPGEKGALLRCKSAVDRLVRHGRSSGIGTTLITQRPALIDKNVLNQVDTLIIMRLVGPTDIDAIEQWIKRHADKETLERILGSLSTLGTGEGWVYSPEWLEMLKRVRFRMRDSFDSSRTPKPGERIGRPKELATVDVDALGKEMKATVERAKADDPKALRAEIAALKKQIATAKPTVETKVERVEVVPKAINRAVTELCGAFNDLQPKIDAVLQTARIKLVVLTKLCEEVETAKEVVPNERPARVQAVVVRPQRREVVPATNGSIAKGERSVLIALAQYPEGCGRDQLSILTGYKRSTRDAYVQRLSTAGYATVNGTTVYATEAGIAALGDDYEELPTGSALGDYWIARLPEGESKILKELIWSGRKVYDRETLSEKTGYQRSTRDAYIQRLKARRLVSVSRDGVIASEILFE